MKTLSTFALAAGALAMSSAAMAGPHNIALAKKDKKNAQKAPLMLSGVMDNPFSDNFDGYAAGSGIAGQGGWELWDATSPNAFVDSSIASSAPNSLRLDAGSDVVKLVNLTSGKWRIRGQTYFPSTASTPGYFIALNTFPYVNISSWSIEVEFTVAGWVQEYGSFGSGTPAVRDQWVPIVAEIDLDLDRMNIWYGGVQIVTDRPWSTNLGGGGAVRLQCIDLYAGGSFGTGTLFYDNIVLEQVVTGCYPNCDQSTVMPILNVDDFTCFINAYASAQGLPPAQQVTDYANCDGSTVQPVLNVDDFTCFINQYAQGCP
jgi:hypothetical protein